MVSVLEFNSLYVNRNDIRQHVWCHMVLCSHHFLWLSLMHNEIVQVSQLLVLTGVGFIALSVAHLPSPTQPKLQATQYTIRIIPVVFLHDTNFFHIVWASHRLNSPADWFFVQQLYSGNNKHHQRSALLVLREWNSSATGGSLSQMTSNEVIFPTAWNTMLVNVKSIK